MAITDSWLRSIGGKPQERIITKSDRDGLSVRVTPKGKVVFQFRYRWGGKGDRIDIGTYPATSLKDARDAAIFYRSELEQYRNPKIVKRTLQKTALTAATVESLIREWWMSVMQDSKVRAVKILRSFELHVFPKIGNLPHDEVTLHIWLSLIEDITKSCPAVGASILSRSKQAHKWAVRRGITKLAPLSEVTAKDLGVQKRVGERTLSEEEVVILFNIIESPKYNPRNALIIKLCLLFGCRVGELFNAKLIDFDFDRNVWVVPPENHKSGRQVKKPIIRPIILEAKELIEQAKKLNQGSEYLFTVSDGKPFALGSHASLIAVLNKKMSKYFKSYIPWSIHDLRRTMRTGVSELAPPHVAETMIGHKLPGVWQVYDKHTYLNEQREAYTRWWEKLTKIVSRSPSPQCPS
ncbi:tyrosine-type recombinase/integrase [Photorhabdus tasmaniensis]